MRVNFEALKKSFRKLGLKLPIKTVEEMKPYMGKSTEYIYKNILPDNRLSDWATIREEVRKEYDLNFFRKYGKLFPGVIDKLNRLKIRKYKLAICTVGGIKYLSSARPAFGLDKYLIISLQPRQTTALSRNWLKT